MSDCDSDDEAYWVLDRLEQFQFKHLPLCDCLEYAMYGLTIDSIIEEIDTYRKSIIVMKDHIQLYHEGEGEDFKIIYKDIYYYIKIPSGGLTYKSLFTQMEEQYVLNDYENDYMYYDEEYGLMPNDNHIFIECFEKKTDVMYQLGCGS